MAKLSYFPRNMHARGRAQVFRRRFSASCSTKEGGYSSASAATRPGLRTDGPVSPGFELPDLENWKHIFSYDKNGFWLHTFK